MEDIADSENAKIQDFLAAKRQKKALESGYFEDQAGEVKEEVGLDFNEQSNDD